jgi:ATPase subunit of ABC transporter with duplicated ATPase domains
VNNYWFEDEKELEYIRGGCLENWLTDYKNDVYEFQHKRDFLEKVDSHGFESFADDLEIYKKFTESRASKDELIMFIYENFV